MKRYEDATRFFLGAVAGGAYSKLEATPSPIRGVLWKRYSENIQQLRHRGSPVNFLHIFRTPIYV